MYLTVIPLYLANSGVPLFTHSIFSQFLLLIPIIAIEAYIHKKLLRVRPLAAIMVAFYTNLVSTFVGGLLIAFPFGIWIGSIVFGTGGPVQPDSTFLFLQLEFIITLIIMFFISVTIELFLGSFSLKNIDKKRLNKSFFIANFFSYLMLEVFAITQIIKAYIERYG